MESLFVMYALHLEPTGQDQLSQSPLMYYSTLKRAESAAAEYRQTYSFLYEDGPFPKELYCIIIEEYKFNTVYPIKLSVSVYDSSGGLMERSTLPDGDSIYQPLDNAKPFKVGDIVEAPCGEHLYIGIIAEMPRQNRLGELKTILDDSYTLIVYPSMELDYVYAPLVFLPRQRVSKKAKTYLHDALDLYRNEGRII